MGSVLTTKNFLERVWPAQGPYIIAFPITRKDGTKGYAHRECQDIDEAVLQSQSICFADQKDVYFCVHAIITGKTYDPTLQKWKAPSRKHVNMREGRVFFFDLDVGEGDNKYSSRDQALMSLQKFLFRTGLPDPLIVSSGGGYHVYWLLSAAIPSVEWRAYADRMRWLASHHGMLVDPTRTTDQSSVLRVVGTKNYKPDVLAKVQAITVGEETQTIDFIDALKSKTEGYTPLATLLHTTRTGNVGTMYDGRVTPAEEVFEVCEQMRTFRDSMGNLPEPAWFVSVGAMRWVNDGEALVHEISQGDPRYSEAETQAKIDHWSDKSVPSCEKIALEFGNDVCDRCPLKGTGKNPLDIANKVWAKAAIKPTVAQLQSGAIPLEPPCAPPTGYTRGNAGVHREVNDPAQGAVVSKLLLPYDLFPVAKYMGNRTEPGHSEWMTTIPLKGQTLFTLEDSAMVDPREFASSMLANDVIITDQNASTQVRTYMLHYLQKLQREAQATKVHDHYGWDYQDDSKMSTRQAFVIHGRQYVLAEKAWKPAAMAGSMKEGAAMMGEDGSFDAHFQAMQFYNRPQYRHVQFMYLAGLSVPWYYAAGEHGMIISATGKSGASKSATLKAISGQWGSPERYMLNGSPDGATRNAYGDRMMMQANIPFTVDEVTNQSTEAINNAALGSSQGVDRLTMTHDRKLRAHRGGIRHSIIFMSSNTSLVTIINATNAAGQAGLARIIEIDFPKGPTNEKTDADRAIRALRQNYGHVGPMLIEGLAPQTDQIEHAIQERSDKLNATWALAAPERFTGGAVASMYEVAVRAYDLGLHCFDVDEVMAWVEEVQLPRQRAIMAAQDERSNPLEVLSTYLAQFHGEAVRIDEDGKGNLSGIISVPNSRNLAYRFDIHAGQIWVRAEHFSRYCIDRRLDYAHVIRVLQKSRIVIDHDRKSLLQGIPNYQQSRNMCYVIDMNHPRMAGVIARVAPVT
jgi:hypothetical protein